MGQSGTSGRAWSRQRGRSQPATDGGPRTVYELIRQAEEALHSLREPLDQLLWECGEQGEDNGGFGDEGEDDLGGIKTEDLDYQAAQEETSTFDKRNGL